MLPVISIKLQTQVDFEVLHSEDVLRVGHIFSPLLPFDLKTVV
jgi:hypothetical protein